MTFDHLVHITFIFLTCLIEIIFNRITNEEASRTFTCCSKYIPFDFIILFILLITGNQIVI